VILGVSRGKKGGRQKGGRREAEGRQKGEGQEARFPDPIHPRSLYLMRLTMDASPNNAGALDAMLFVLVLVQTTAGSRSVLARCDVIAITPLGLSSSMSISYRVPIYRSRGSYVSLRAFGIKNRG
jgi:hypothetical protein